MKSNRFKSILLKILKAFLILAIVISASIGFVFQFVLTPEKITPKIVKALNENLNAKVALDKVELTFFTTFPSFKLELNEGLITQKNDSLSTNVRSNDTLIQFERALVSVNPVSLLRNKLNINEFEFRKPTIFARIDQNGAFNWDILKEQDDQESDIEKKQEKPQDSASALVTAIQLKNIRVIDGQVIFDDRYAKNFMVLNGFDIDLDATYSEEEIALDLFAQSDETSFSKQGKVYTEKLLVEIDTDLFVDRSTKSIELQEARVGLNDLYFQLMGNVKPKKERQLLDVDLRFSLDVPNLQSLIKILPEDLIDKKADYQAKGEVGIDGQVKGQYGKDEFPDLKADIVISDGSLYYQKKGQGIDLLEADISISLPSDPENASTFNLKKLNLKGVGTDLKLTGSGRNLFEEPDLELAFNGFLDLKTFQKSVPLKKDIEMEGSVHLDLLLELPTAVFKNEDYGDIYALGNLKLNKLNLTNHSDQISMSLEKLEVSTAQHQNSPLMNQTPGRALQGSLNLRDFQASYLDSTSAQLNNLQGSFMTLIPKDSSIVSTVEASLSIDGANLKSGDTLKAQIQSTSGEFKLSPQIENPKLPRIISSFRIDSTGAVLNGKYAGVTKGNYHLSSNKTGKKWPLTGEIIFDKMEAFTPTFPLTISLPKTTVVLKPGLIKLDEAQINMGSSDFKASGQIYDIGDAFLGEKDFKGELELISNMIDVNEIIQALIIGAKERSNKNSKEALKRKESSNSDEKKSLVFVVPENLDLKMDTHFSQVRFKNFDLNNVNGRITLKDQRIELENLGLVTMAAKMATTISYSNPSAHEAKLDFDFKLHEIDLSKLTQMMPVIDSLLPMANSFEGKVNFRMKGGASLDEQMNMVATSMNAIARVEGDSLVILDGETFQRVAKMLRFKNTEGKHLDHLEFAMAFKDQTIEIFPSYITIDRYHLAIGGQHGLDASYDYHISVLKSPIPFKLGIDITGSDDDLDIKLAKARYKNLFSDKKKKRDQSETQIIARKKIVLDSLPFN